MLFNILALISLLIVLILLNRLVGIFPSLLACLIRWKESVNLDSSVKLGRDRDIMALCMMIPFCLTVFRFRLYDPSWTDGMLPDPRLAAIIGVFAAYAILRSILEYGLRSKKMNPKTYKTACKASYTFFSVLTLLLLLTGGVLSFIGVNPEDIKNAMLWISALIYMLFIIRKFQISLSSCSFFSGILYLCALELVPTGAVIASAVLL